MHEYHLIIGGKRVAGASSANIINPATEETVAICAVADEAQLNEAVDAAAAAFAGWRATPIEDRRAALMQIAAAIEADIGQIASVLTAEQGKPLLHAQGELMASVGITRALASIEMPAKEMETMVGKAIEHRTPLGVIAAITPWNFPISILSVKIVPALLAGNTVVIKPAPTTPLSTLRLIAIYDRHLPPGVVNVVVDQGDLGAKLTNHPGIAKVSFTGSTATGRRVMESAAGTLKRLTLELGGNDAAIVLDDADPREVAQQLFDGAMMNAGQVCLAIKRAYVHDSLYDAVCDELGRLADAVVVGDGSEQGTQMGPLQNKVQYDRVRSIIAEAAQEGSIVAGGTDIGGPGYFIRPTIVRDIGDEARLVREEQFGPVLPVLRYSDIDDAITRANRSEYGLAGTVWSSDTARATEVAMRIDSGTVWVNCHMNIDPFTAVGGAKQSGVGVAMGLDGLHEFTQRHVVYIAGPAA